MVLWGYNSICLMKAQRSFINIFRKMAGNNNSDQLTGNQQKRHQFHAIFMSSRPLLQTLGQDLDLFFYIIILKIDIFV